MVNASNVIKVRLVCSLPENLILYIEAWPAKNNLEGDKTNLIVQLYVGDRSAIKTWHHIKSFLCSECFEIELEQALSRYSFSIQHSIAPALTKARVPYV